MNYENILLKRDGDVATIVLNRPEKLNAVTPKMVEELAQATGCLALDDAVRVIKLTGAGRAFCAGGDPSSFDTFQAEGLEKSMGHFAQLGKVAINLRNATKPTLAVVNGPAMGAGLSIALGCDIIVASEGAKFSVAFSRMALHLEGGITYILPRRVGVGKACELIFTGRTVDAQEAERIGLVNQVVPQEQLEQKSKELAEMLAKAAPLAIGLSKISLYQGLDISLIAALEREIRAQAICMSTRDVKEAANAFLEKRPATFSGQ